MKVIELNECIVSKIGKTNENYQAYVLHDDLTEVSYETWYSLYKELDYALYGIEKEGNLVAFSAIGKSKDIRMDRWKEVRSLYVDKNYKDKTDIYSLIETLVDRKENRGFENTYFWLREDDFDVRDFFEKGNIIPNGNRQERLLKRDTVDFLRYVFVNV